MGGGQLLPRGEGPSPPLVRGGQDLDDVVPGEGVGGHVPLERLGTVRLVDADGALEEAGEGVVEEVRPEALGQPRRVVALGAAEGPRVRVAPPVPVELLAVVGLERAVGHRARERLALGVRARVQAQRRLPAGLEAALGAPEAERGRGRAGGGVVVRGREVLLQQAAAARSEAAVEASEGLGVAAGVARGLEAAAGVGAPPRHCRGVAARRLRVAVRRLGVAGFLERREWVRRESIPISRTQDLPRMRTPLR